MGRPRRLEHVAYRGPARYFLTFCTNQRRPVFRHSEVVDSTLAQFRTTAGEEGVALLAYCFMPDHVHLLVEALGATSDLRRFTKMSKQRSGGVFSRSFGCRLWQEGYFERVVRNSDRVSELIRYILQNPVRAGLVSDPRDYPHLGSDVWSLDALLEGAVE